jgi:hypothetical protein
MSQQKPQPPHRQPTMDEWVAMERDRLPAPGDTPIEHLRHTVAAFEDAPEDDRAISATGGIYPDRPWTGVTWGDLRAILVRLESAELTGAAWCWEHSCEWAGPCSPQHD